MSAHAAAPHAAHEEHHEEAPHEAAHAAPSEPSYFSNVFNRVRSGMFNVFVGPLASLGKGIYDSSAQEGHEWDRSVLQPLGHGAVSAVCRPFQAIKTLFHHEGQWGFNPGKAWNELGDWAEDPFHQGGRMLTRGVSALSDAYHRVTYGFGQLLRAPGGQAPDYSTANNFAGLPMDPSAAYARIY